MLLNVVSEEALASIGNLGLLAGLYAGMWIIMLIIMLAVYIFIAIAMSTLANKLNYDKPWLAWIPVANLFLIPILAEYKWWWGFAFVLPYVLGLIPILGLILMPIASIFSAVMCIIWWVKIFKRRNYSPWLMLLFLVPIANIVIFCLLVWKDKQ